MPENQFDELFRSKLQTHSSPVPEDMWQRIQRKKDKDRKGLILWYSYFLGSLLLLIIVTSGYFMLQTDKNNSIPKNTLLINEHARDTQANKNKMAATAKNGKKINIKRDTAYLGQTNKISAPKYLHNDKNEKHANKTAAKKYKSRKSILMGNDPENGYSSKQTAIKVNVDKKIQLDSDNNNQADSLRNESAPSTNIPFVDNKKREPVIITGSDDSNTKPEQSKPTPQKDSSTKKASDFISAASKKARNQGYLNKKDWFLEVYGSPDFPFDDIKPDYEYFHPGRSYTVGLRLGKSFGGDFSAKTGIQYSQINLFTRSDSNYIKGNIYYKSMDLPLLIGYEIKGGHDILTFNAGVIFNIYSWYSGSFFGTDPNDILKAHTGLSLYVGLDYTKPLNKNFLIFTEPFFRYRLSNMANGNQIFTQKINVAGLTLGVRYNLGKR